MSLQLIEGLSLVLVISGLIILLGPVLYWILPDRRKTPINTANLETGLKTSHGRLHPDLEL
ncbi:MAG: hypothetical protein QNJ46_24280 [Leptolyngbyaceae cyanobacterium MO_188.B28]|nr:hypothetical protein [Leptolyngbyaceae cyanobacterium MO_188.B28]